MLYIDSRKFPDYLGKERGARNARMRAIHGRLRYICFCTTGAKYFSTISPTNAFTSLLVFDKGVFFWGVFFCTREFA